MIPRIGLSEKEKTAQDKLIEQFKILKPCITTTVNFTRREIELIIHALEHISQYD